MKPARELDARYAGTCADCGQPIAVGDPITYRRPDAVHRACTLPDAPTTTHRERLEARADRRDAWAESRAAKADAATGRGSQMLDAIPFGQPIHGARDRNYRDKARDAMQRGYEHGKKATEHASRAEGTRAQLRASIYDDDPDAVAQLAAKLDRLEAERARWTAYNAACRKRKPATSTERDAIAVEILTEREAASLRPSYVLLRKFGQAPSYHTSNLSGQISTIRQRLARLTKAE